MYILKGFCDTKGNTLLNFSNKVAVYPDEAIKSSWNSHSSLVNKVWYWPKYRRLCIHCFTHYCLTIRPFCFICLLGQQSKHHGLLCHKVLVLTYFSLRCNRRCTLTFNSVYTHASLFTKKSGTQILLLA